MKQCPNCRRTYSDNLAYCLEDGAALIAAYDVEATQVNSPMPLSNLPPTEVYAKLPPTAAYQAPPLPASPLPAPAPQRKSRAWIVGVVVVAALVVGLVVGGLLFKHSGSETSSSSPPAATPTPARATTPAVTPTPTATITPAVVTATATPTPSPLATPSPAKVESQSECVLYNDKADREGVRVRLNCDTQDCDSDESTIAGEYPDETPINVVKGSSVKGKRFTWVKVVILQSKRTVWVASTKIKC